MKLIYSTFLALDKFVYDEFIKRPKKPFLDQILVIRKTIFDI